MSDQPRGIPGLDRQQMEQERLARLSKKRVIEDSKHDTPNKAVKVESSQTSSAPAQSTSSPSHEPQIPQNSHLEFPHGTIRRTWAFGHSRNNDIKIGEVIRKQDLKIAVISSFNWDFDFLVTKFDTKTKFILVMQAKDDREKQAYQSEFQGLPRVRLCFPPMFGNQFGSMHSKLMLLFYPTHLRIVIPSANFVPHDWGENGIMENSVFVVDLPRLAEERQGHANDTLNAFSKELLRFVEAMTLDEDVKLGILNFDFSNTADMYFVHSIAGTHLGKAADYTGLPGLGRAVRTLDLGTTSTTPLEVEMAASSVSGIDNDSMDLLYSTLHGHELKRRTFTKRKFEDYLPTATIKQDDAFHIVFPTRETVAQSTGGQENGGTIFLRPDLFKKTSFPSQMIRDYRSRRTGLLSHNKLIFVRSPKTAFLYMGSSNLSQAAWGKLVYDKESKGPKLTVRNWECGVLLPVVRNGSTVPFGGEKSLAVNDIEHAHRDEQRPEVVPKNVFDRVLQVPWEYPAAKYEKGQKPWTAGS